MKADKVILDLKILKFSIQAMAYLTGGSVKDIETVDNIIDQAIAYIEANQLSKQISAEWLYQRGFTRITVKNAAIQGECSNCGCRPLTRFPAGKPWPYCPNCGAQMQ